MTATTFEQEVWGQIGGRIRMARGWYRASRREVAAKCGFSVSTLARLENGLQKPRPEQLLDLSESLGLSLEFVVLGEDVPPVEDIAVMPLTWKLGQVSKQQAKKALILCEGTLAALGRPVSDPRPVAEPLPTAGQPAASGE